MSNKVRIFILMLAISAIGWFGTQARADDSTHIYVTWAGAEPDKGASAWFIKRYVDHDAVFRVVPQGSLVDAGTPFDVPQGRYRRVHNASTLETLLRDHPSQDLVVQRLGNLMHDIEINQWRPKVFAESQILEARVKNIDEEIGQGGIPMECFIPFFDGVYQWLKSESGNQDPLNTPEECAATKHRH